MRLSARSKYAVIELAREGGISRSFLEKLLLQLKPSFPLLVNEWTARFVALQVCCFSILALYLKYPFLLLFLIYEFFARLLYGPRFSLMVFIANQLFHRLFSFPGKQVPGVPKRFAQMIGLLFTSVAGILWYLTGHFDISFYLLLTLALFSGLEAFLGWCAACYLFSILMKTGIIPHSICEQCTNLDLEE